MESMPSACYPGSSGTYAQKQDPFVYYNDISTNATRCKNDVVPLTQLNPDLANHLLPNFAWITPNLCNDAHDCSGAISDAFMGKEVAKIIQVKNDREVLGYYNLIIYPDTWTFTGGKMNIDSFYAIVSGICFALTGLWWTVVELHKEWLKEPKLRSLAGGVYSSFLIPGVMSLGAQIGGDNKLVWRSVFVIAALLGMFFSFRLLSRIRKLPQPGFFARSRWLVIVVYLVIAVLGVEPTFVAATGLTPIQVEAFLLCIIILMGHGLAWEMMTHRLEESAPTTH